MKATIINKQAERTELTSNLAVKLTEEIVEHLGDVTKADRNNIFDAIICRDSAVMVGDNIINFTF